MSDQELCGSVLCWDVNDVKDEEELKELVGKKHATSFYVHKQSFRFVEVLKKLVSKYTTIPALFAADVGCGPGDAIENEETLPQLMAWGLVRTRKRRMKQGNIQPVFAEIEVCSLLFLPS